METRKPLEIPFPEWRSRWLTFGKGTLHRVSEIEWSADFPGQMIIGTGVTVCGRKGELTMPGIFSRMGSPRCHECCSTLGIPRGKGCPENAGIWEPGDRPSPSAHPLNPDPREPSHAETTGGSGG